MSAVLAVVAASEGGVPPVPLATFTYGGNAAAFTLAWPAGHQSDDVGILLVETGNEALATPSGWTAVNTPTGTGPAAANNSTRLYAFYRVATSGAEANASIADSGDHQTAVMFVLRGADTVSPIEAVTGDLGTGVNTTVPTTTTLGPNRYVVGACSDAGNPGTDNNASIVWTANSSLDNFVELADYGNASVFTAMIGAFGGQMLAAGAVGTTSGTFVSSGAQERVIFAVKPVGG
jgi:hypothetical protein